MLSLMDLTVDYETEESTVRAVDEVSLNVDDGEIVGIVGESGCGKSTLLKAIQRILSSNAVVPSGSIEYNGTDILSIPEPEFRSTYALKEIATIPQASMDSFDPVYKLRRQFAESINVHEGKQDRADIDARIAELFNDVGLDKSLADKYPHELSGGQIQRVLIANSFILQPRLVLADEPTTGLDLLTKTRILRWLKDYQRERGFSLLLISHDLPLIAQMSDKLGVMYAGDLVEFGEASDIFNRPSHPYTKGLIESTMHVRKDEDTGHIPGTPPTITAGHEGCKFRNRCPFEFEECARTPPLTDKEGHPVACHLSTGEMGRMREQARDVFTEGILND